MAAFSVSRPRAVEELECHMRMSVHATHARGFANCRIAGRRKSQPRSRKDPAYIPRGSPRSSSTTKKACVFVDRSKTETPRSAPRRRDAANFLARKICMRKWNVAQPRLIAAQNEKRPGFESSTVRNECSEDSADVSRLNRIQTDELRRAH